MDAKSNLIFLIVLNGFATFLSGVGFVFNIITKDIDFITWLCIVSFILNLFCFSMNVYRLKHKWY